ncbi:MAG: PQQ-like beta-propeller repeat protein, partial [Planctomycetaceae bacterium]|nr:PQQ-like beta-propeller repeat protein [Planctomycetaceae bacterium]
MRRIQELLALTLILTSVVVAGDWPQWRGVHRDGVAADEAIRDDWSERPPELLWMVEGMGAGYASVSIAHGVLYTTGNDETSQFVVAVDAMTGKRLWSTSLTDEPPSHSYPGARCTPTVDGDRLYVTTSNGAIVCLLRDDGSVIWKKDFSPEWQGQLMSHWGFSESPLVDGDAVLCTPGGPDALIVKLDKLSGEEIWRSAVPKSAFNGQAPPAGYSSIVISQGGGVKQYVQMTGRGLVGVRADDGKVLWSYGRIANGTANVPTPIVIDDYIFASTGYGAGAALIHLEANKDSEVTAEEVYFLDGNTFQNHHGGMVRYGDFIYAGNGKNNGFPTCVEWRTGDIAWGGKLRGAGSGSAAVTGLSDNILFRYQDGVIAL